LSGLRVRLVIVTVCVVAPGCTATPQTPSIAPAMAPAAVALPTAPVSVNGTYNGIMQLVQGTPMSCGTEDVLTLRVTNDAFSYTLNQPQVPDQPTRIFNVAIASDGSFQAASGAAYIRGTASGGHMAGNVFGDACGFHFEADSSGNW